MRRPTGFICSNSKVSSGNYITRNYDVRLKSPRGKIKFNKTSIRYFTLSIVVFWCNCSVAFGQLSGVKNIPGDYISVTTAVNALNIAGVGSGGVTFNVAAGYTETVASTISLTATGTAANPIIFQKDPATTGSNPLITAYTGGVGTPSTAVQDGIWRLIGSDYVTINGIDITDNPANTTVAATMEYGYALYKASTSNGCQFVTIENCIITLNNLNNAAGSGPMVDGSTGIVVMNALFSTAATTMTPITGGQNSNNKLYGNTIQNCNNGIAIVGYAAASPFTLADANNDIGGSSSSTGNTIINFGGAAAAANAANGIRTLAQYGLNISYNTLNSNNGSGTNHPNILRGIYMNAATSANASVTFNTVTVKGGGTTQALEGIENVAGATAASNTINISNNIITNSNYPTATTGGFYGILNNGATPAILTISNNTISNNSSAATTTGFFYGIQNSGAASSANINSNIISGNSTAALTTGLFLGIYNSVSLPILNINSNTLSGNSTSALSGVYYAIYNKGTIATTININSNNIGTSISPAINFTAANSGAQVLINNNKGGAAAALSISNNNFYNVLYTVPGTGTQTLILNSAATFTQAINGNTFTNMNVNTTNVTFISNSVIVPSGGTQNVNGNTVSGTFAKAGNSGTVTLFSSAASSVSGSVINNNSNNFSNISVSGAAVIAGWANTDAGASNKTIQNNTFSNWTAGTGAVTAMNINLTGATNSTTGNAINNITGAGTIVGITTSAGNNKIYSNTINTLATTGAVAVTGIVVSGGTNQNIYANKIYDLQANNAIVGATVNGIMVSGTTIVNVNIYNNLIGDLRTPSSSATDPIRALDLISTAVNSTINVYYNSIYINATSTGANFGTTGIYHTTSATATTSVLNLRNNIVNNVSTPNGTGLTVAYRRSTTALANYASTSNNNLLYAGPAATNRLIFYDGTNSDQILSAYKTRVSPRDAASVTEDLFTSSKFLSTSGSSAVFLHLDPTKATLAESGGVNIANFTIDYDAQARQGNAGYTGAGTAPDIGADEFQGSTISALSGTYNVGTGQTYTSLTAAGGLFAAINSLGLSGNVVVNVTSDLAEDGSNVLYPWVEQGLGNYTLTIQTNTSTVKTISGNVLTGLIRLNGAKRVTIDGSNGTTSNFLTFRNTNTAGTTGTGFTFINGASNNTIKYCNTEAYANATNGVMLFSTSTAAGGNSSNVISNCSINATVSSNTGNVGIYSAGTVGNENATNTISNNNIFNYRDRALDITATGSKTWTINGNSFYNGGVTGAINYAAASTLHGIRILGGTGYAILNNYVGGSAPLASGANAVYASTLGIISYQGILLTTSAATPASNIKGNTVAGISVSAVPTSTTAANVFIGIETNGSGINIGGSLTGDGNTIGSNTANGSVTVTTTTSTATFLSIIRGVNCLSSGGLVTGNQVGSIDIKNIGTAPAPSTFIGIFINNASPPSQVSTNVIGSTGTGAASNSIRVLSTSTSTTTSLTGISVGALVTSTIQVSGNIVQNLSYQNSSALVGNLTGISSAAITPASVTITNNTITGNSTSASTGGLVGILSSSAPASVSISNNTISNNSSTSGTTGFLYGVQNSGAAATVSITGNIVSGNTTALLTTGVFLGIYNSSATPVINVTGNTISGNATTAVSGPFYAIYNSGAVTTTININNNNIGTGSGASSAITYNAANSGTQIMINNIAGTSAAALSISNNNFQGINYATAGTGAATLISNSAATLSQAINGNTFTNLNINTAGSVIFITNNVAVSATGAQNVNNNAIVTAFTKKAGGILTLFTSSTATSLAGAVINNSNNNFSNITVTGATTIAGWVNTDPGAAAKNIQNNTFSNWTCGTAAVTAMSVNIVGSSNAISGNLVNNISGGGAITGITTGAGNTNIFSNTINTLSSTAVAAVTGIAVTGGTSPNIYKNKIYDLSNSSTTGTVNGMLISGGTTVTVYNNLIGDLRTPAANSATDLIRGINITSATASSSINIYFNTIYINASSTGASFSSTGIYHTMNATATTAALNLRNNSITNTSTPKGTGTTVAYRRSGTTLTNYAATSNNNLFYAGTPSATKLIYTDGTNSDQTIAAFITRMATRDAQSVSENITAKFLSTTGSSSVFLHMDSAQPTLVESGAVNIGGITDDFDGQIRAGNTGYTGSSSSPDIGADEIFGVETNPPTITYTLLTNTTSTTNRNVTGVTITDASGVSVATGTKPRIYYKRVSDGNVWLDNSPGTDGWKYTEATNSSSSFTFTIDYTLLHGGASVTAGVIQYFIVAQDVATTANIAINSGAFTVPPASVALTSAAFPITGTINSYNIPFSGSYNVGNTEVFTSLTRANGLFAAINTAGLAGNATFNITSDIAEDGTNALNKWTESGAGNYTLTIQPDAATLRTVSGNVLSGLIRLNGSNRVTINGSNGGSGVYLSFKNTNTAGTTGTAFTFINGASNNTIRYCDAEAYANSTNGVILFSTSGAGGNSGNLVDNCIINATVASNTGSAAVYSAGTIGNENSSNTISNNQIYNYRDRAIDIAAASTGWTISGNDIFNGTVTGSINYAAASALNGIKISGGAGYTVLNNNIGGNSAGASGINAVYSSSLGSITYQGISLTTTGASPASAIKGNTIAAMSLSTIPTAANSNIFSGIETGGQGINIGGSANGDGNMIGSASVNSSIIVTTTTTTATNSSLINGVNCASTGGIVIGNQVSGIDVSNIGVSAAPSAFTGIFINSASAPSQVNDNVIGSSGTGAVSNSIRVLPASTALTTSLTGIVTGPSVASSVQINGNTIQNISNLSTTSSGSFTGINNLANNSAAVITITRDTVKFISTASNNNVNSTIYTGISSVSPSTISSNTISNLLLAATGTAAQVRGVSVAGAFSYTISANNIANLSTGSTKTADIETGDPSGYNIVGILNLASVSGQVMSADTLSNFSATATNVINTAVTGIAVTGGGSLGNIFNNRISAFTNKATGTSPLPGISGIMGINGSFNVYNNAIKLDNSSNTNGLKIYGINDAAGSNWNYFFNSVKIAGSATGAGRTAGFIRTVAGNLTLRNNVFVNTRTGTGPNYAISNITVPVVSNWPSGASNYNDLYSSTAGTTGEWGSGVSQTFSQFQSASAGETNSANSTVTFITSVYNLQPDSLTNCALSNVGTPVTTPVAISTDINNSPRNTITPDLGAYEFNFTAFVIVASNSSPVCLGGTVDLSVDPGLTSNPVYSWRSPANTIISTSQNPTVMPIAGWYKVTVTDANGCFGVDSTLVTLNTRPTATLTGSSVACAGSSTTLTLHVTGSGAISGSLSSGDVFSGTAPTIPVTVTPLTTTTYTIVSLQDLNCSAVPSDIPDSVSVVVVQPGGWLGTTSSNWRDPANWCGGVPIATTNVLIPAGSSTFPVISTGTNPVNDITIESGTSLTVTGAVLQIGGAIDNSGTFTASNGTIEMNDSSPQIIPAATFSGNTINNLTINNSGGVTLNGTLNLSGVLLPAAGTFNTGGFLTLTSTATQTALIDGSGAGAVLGNVTMQRYLNAGFGYKYFSSPFQAATVSNFSSTVDLNASFSNFYTYIENQASSGFTSYSTSTNVLSPMQGYAADFGAATAQKIVSITGVVNNGTLSSSLFNHNQPYTQGFNLVGNPYPSPIDWNASSGWTKTNIDNAIYYFDSGTTDQYSGAYSTFINGVSSDGVANNIIASMQGFFLHVSNGTYPVAGTLAVNNNVRVNNLNPVFHKSFSAFGPAPRILVRLSANFSDNSASSDPLVVYTDEKATPAFEKNLDALKLMNIDDKLPNLYSLRSDVTKLVINALPKLDTLTVIPVGLQISKDGVVSFVLRDVEQWPDNLHLYLFDAKTGLSQDLQQNARFDVSLKSGTYENRFSLRCLPSKTSVNKTDIYSVYGSGGKVFIHIKLVENQNGYLMLSNMSGQIMSRKTIDGNGDYELDGHMVDAIYVVSFVTAKGMHSKKIFLVNR
ncbi:hypothetical protein [Mucilaginibacter sp.]|uniref:beta strand repeat-containing protein n=1 Tax=Mucilaginibacter sp. TaxID=1882438 RepID=UPI0025DB39AC|nr:hypothetical protein [Mucilaginibacter sp.]